MPGINVGCYSCRKMPEIIDSFRRRVEYILLLGKNLESRKYLSWDIINLTIVAFLSKSRIYSNDIYTDSLSLHERGLLCVGIFPVSLNKTLSPLIERIIAPL